VECTRWKPSPDDTFQPPPIPEFSSQTLPRERADFDIPIDAKGLLVYARGASSSGAVRVRESSDVKDLKVSVFAHFWDRRALSKAKVCLIERKNGPNGVAILVPSPLNYVTDKNLTLGATPDPVPVVSAQEEG
jgi:hypothetical protein